MTESAERPRALTLTLSQPFVDSLDEQQLSAYVATLVDASDHAGDNDELDLDAALAERFGAIGVAVPDLERRNLAEQLRTADGHLAVVLADGTVLHGLDADAPAAREPDVQPTEDPSSQERPFYS